MVASRTGIGSAVHGRTTSWRVSIWWAGRSGATPFSNPSDGLSLGNNLSDVTIVDRPVKADGFDTGLYAAKTKFTSNIEIQQTAGIAVVGGDITNSGIG